jgi:hypothetical protein
VSFDDIGVASVAVRTDAVDGRWVRRPATFLVRRLLPPLARLADLASLLLSGRSFGTARWRVRIARLLHFSHAPQTMGAHRSRSRRTAAMNICRLCARFD